MYDKRYIEFVPKNRLTCRYKRLNEYFKREFQNGGSLFRQLDMRTDKASPQVEEIKQFLLRKARVILLYNDVVKKRNEVKLLNNLIDEKISQLS